MGYSVPVQSIVKFPKKATVERCRRYRLSEVAEKLEIAFGHARYLATKYKIPSISAGRISYYQLVDFMKAINEETGLDIYVIKDQEKPKIVVVDKFAEAIKKSLDEMEISGYCHEFPIKAYEIVKKYRINGIKFTMRQCADESGKLYVWKLSEFKKDHHHEG